ncbi:52 kDa repressor of the inhibitor of the protein kinase-like isoform X2 [Anthonomus grandis grandis]|uniref:52 kDa repressor of the inhibitor of the protein kinase-like isoform X2 n=1 Tax=Anthonomus grandis grandis TaxID=2921223 RepID=UPI002165A7F1|nr:52 kDa repressor of the inhibitor of the protein kinase-like isoform X2 [Anthonomus grandis grandis]
MANRVIEEIAKQIKANKYFSVSVDSTPDISHQDQLTIILRYCNSKGLPFERFIGFYDNIGHGAQELEQCVMDMLKTFNLDIQNCRGQSYDNASNMSGRFSGLQARIKAHNELAIYVLCAGHSLNLVVQNSADCCFEATLFLMLVQAFYTFFSASTHRWNLLSSTIRDSSGAEKSLMPKRVNTTRWSSRFDAIKALQSSYNSIKTCLNNIVTDVNEKNIVRVEASSLCEKLNFLENGIILSFWLDILQRVNDVNKTVQKENLDLCTTSQLFSSLVEYFDFLRDRFDHYESLGMLFRKRNLY